MGQRRNGGGKIEDERRMEEQGRGLKKYEEEWRWGRKGVRVSEDGTRGREEGEKE